MFTFMPNVIPCQNIDTTIIWQAGICQTVSYFFLGSEQELSVTASLSNCKVEEK